MKLAKLLLLALPLLVASCSDDDGPAKQPPLKSLDFTIDFTTVAQAVYNGDKYANGAGCYRLVLTNADGDELVMELIDAKAVKPSVAMPAVGRYAAAETHLAGTLVASASCWRTGKAGAAVRSANADTKKEYQIAAGGVVLAAAPAADGTWTLRGDVNDGDITHLEFTWSGSLIFENESGESDPVEYENLSMVFGDYYHDDYGVAADTYMLQGGNERVEIRSQFRSTAAADMSAPLPTDGVYTVDIRSEEGTYANEVFTFRQGYYNTSGSPKGTYWKTDEGAYIATSGSFTVSTVNGQWKIEGILHDDEAGEQLAFTFTGTPGFSI